MNKISSFILSGAVIMLLSSSCSVLQQTSEMANFGKCEFRIESARNMKLGGVNIQGKDATSDLTVTDMAKIMGVIAGGTLLLVFDLNIQVKNPNPTLAAMNKLDWILIIDDVEMTRGILNQRVEVPANSVTEFPVAMNFDLMKSLSGKSGSALINFAMNLAGASNRPTQIKLKAKPTIYIGEKPIAYPGYITISQEFSSN